MFEIVRRDPYWIPAWARRLRDRNKRAYHFVVEPRIAPAQLVVISAQQLDDLLELSRLAVDRLDEIDPLRAALLGSIGAVRMGATLEP